MDSGQSCALVPYVTHCTLCLLPDCRWRNGRARTMVGSRICEDSVSVEAGARTTRGSEGAPGTP
eukprot:3579004-Rhodomonas_salina.1